MKRNRHSTTITCRYFIMIVTGFQQNIALKQSRCLTVAQPAAKRSIRADLPFARQSKKKCGIFYEPGTRKGNKPTDGLLWYPRRTVFDTSHQKRPCALREGERGGTTRAGRAPDGVPPSRQEQERVTLLSVAENERVHQRKSAGIPMLSR